MNMSPENERLPFIHDLKLPYKLTFLLAGLLSLSSIAGLFFGSRGWYDTSASTFPALVGQDVIMLLLTVPFVLISATVAHQGSLKGLLCWMGTLFYVSYFYYFNLLGVRFNPLFPVYIGIVSIGVYSLLALMFAIDPEQIKSRFGTRMPTRTVAFFLIGISSAFVVIWTALIASELLAARQLETVTRLVIAIDGVVLLPLSFFAGLSLWRRVALAYALSCLLLVDIAATFLTLLATTYVAALWGQDMDPLMVLYVAGLSGSAFLLVAIDRRAKFKT